MVITTAAPPGVIVLVASVASLSVSETLPVPAPDGSTRIVYVPPAGRYGISRNPPLVSKLVEANVLPSGFFTVYVVVPETVTPLTVKLTCCPEAPVKVTSAFWPGVTVVIGVVPPAVIVAVTFTMLKRLSVMLPVLVLAGSTMMV